MKRLQNNNYMGLNFSVYSDMWLCCYQNCSTRKKNQANKEESEEEASALNVRGTSKFSGFLELSKFAS